MGTRKKGGEGGKFPAPAVTGRHRGSSNLPLSVRVAALGWGSWGKIETSEGSPAVVKRLREDPVPSEKSAPWELRDPPYDFLAPSQFCVARRGTHGARQRIPEEARRPREYSCAF